MHILITNFNNHWDGTNGKAKFPKNLFKLFQTKQRYDCTPHNNTNAIFIKIDRISNEIKQSWHGSVDLIEVKDQDYEFTFTLTAFSIPNSYLIMNICNM